MSLPLTARPDHSAATLPRLLAATGASLDGHLRRYGAVPYRGSPGLLAATVAEAGLTGRGGAAFPTHRKLRAVAERPGRTVVVANGAEGEPASRKDRLLLSTAPHLVLDGLQLAVEAVGARRGYVYVHRDRRVVDALMRALAERERAGLDRVRVDVVTAPARFLSGEESALASSVSGGPARPRSTPPRVYESGVRGRPTLVQNVETLAHIALLARYGAGWFRALGTPDEPGSMLFSVAGAVHRPGVVEAEIGTPVHDVLAAAGGPTAVPKAVLVGGYHGAWLTGGEALRLPLANAALSPRGAALGAGVLVALPPDRCGVAESARVARYLANESAGQCGPCLNGLPLIADALASAASRRPDPRSAAHIERWAGLVERRGACHHPDGTARFVRSALRVFADEIAQHRRGRCTATSNEPVLPVPAGSPRRDDWF